MNSPFAKKFCGKKSALTYGKSPIAKIEPGVTGVSNPNDNMSPEDKKATIMTYEKNVADYIKAGGTKSQYNEKHWNEVLSVHAAMKKS